MATAYTLAANATLRDIGNAGIWGVATARTGSDTISTNGFNFTQDQDSRYGLGGNTSAVWANLTILATKGGNLNFDGRYIRLIPFTGGSGTITAGTLITCGAATGKVIGIYSALNVAPVLTGVAAGWIKVTEWNGVAFPTTGAFTQAGYTFTISGADIVGFMEVDGYEAGTISANRLGAVNITGEWFKVGTTSGSSATTWQIPTNGQLRHCAGLFIEKTAGQKDYEFYPNAGTALTIGTDAVRGKVCWISNAGLVRIGHNGTAAMGYLPPTGLEIVIGNIWFENVVTTLTANVIPNSTIATRYDFTTTGGGVINIDKCDMAWYLSVSQGYSVNITNSGFIDAISLSEVATPMTLTKVGVGCKPTTALVVSPLTMTYCYAGGTFTDCVWARASHASALANITLQDIADFTFVRDKPVGLTIRGIATAYSISATRAKDCTWTTPTIIQGSINLITCDGIMVTDTIYVDAVSGTTVTTYAMYVWNLSSNTINTIISGLTMPVTNCQPYTALLIAATGCANIKMRNIGTRAAPLSMGSTNNCALIYTIGTNCSDFKFQRIYVATTRTGIMTGDNSCIRITEENVWGDYADAVDVMAVLNHVRKGMGGTGALTAQTSVYGTHWQDGFTSTTAGRIAILMNEANSLTAAQVTLTGGAAFTSAGGLYMPVIGQTALFETPYYVLGHTSFANSAMVMAGGTATNHTYGFQIDKNDGAGWSTLTSGSTAAQLGTALNGITGIDASKGFKLRIKITTSVTNTAAITSVYLTTVSTTTAQDYQYPLDTITLSLTGLQPGSDIVILDAGTSTERTNVDVNPGTTYSYIYAATGNVDIGVFKAGYVPFYIRNYPLSTANASLPCAQVIDRAYA